MGEIGRRSGGQIEIDVIDGDSPDPGKRGAESMRQLATSWGFVDPP